ncbi:ArsR/SmtB family transcription factor [Brevibacterium sp. Marseille-P9724]|uniref:ArsR/SmtB family transcription factor n=1 Tax=Brevibacterium sp. Marseille-P9724 TaxID=2614125 RepID=UPI00186753D3|nr:helix-turn-helix transcriptional regulator [Brevibacterium sp. Marseille-P9724]
MDPQPDIASVAAHFADRSRAAMMLELLDGNARPVTRLAQVAGVRTSTASEHLSRLAGAGLLVVEPEGRVRRYRLAGTHVAVVLESLLPLASTPAPTGLRQVTRWDRLRVARSCYDHLAGSLGTDILAGLLEAGTLRRTDGVSGTVRGPHDKIAGPAEPSYVLAPCAGEHLARVDVDLTAVRAARRPAVKVCTDWTEQRHHLAGGLGAALMQAFVDLGWIERRPGRRDILVHRPERIQGWLHAV